MTYFADLAPCTYFSPAVPDASSLIAIGWLEHGHDYPRGEIAPAVFDALARLCVNPWQPAMFGGAHRCSLCRFSGGPAVVRLAEKEVSVGSANVFVPSERGVFVAPTTVVHYVDAHGYRPPDAFLEAVLRCPEMRSMPYLRALRASGLSLRRADG